MPEITVRFEFEGADGAVAEVVETEGYRELNILAHAQLVERSLQSRCGGHCECSTCRVVIVSGNVSPARSEESALLTRAKVADMRLACQVFPENGLVIVRVPARRFNDARIK